MTNHFFVTLKNRGLIRLEGPDRHDFLQGLITNDIRKLTPLNPIYACLLTPQGKFLHDFFIIEGDGYTLLDCEGGERAQDLYDRLLRYRLRAEVLISVECQNQVYAILESQNLRISESQSNTFGDSEILRFRDSRNSAMGHRSFTKPDLPEHPFEEWDYRRISLTIPDGCRDLIIDKSTMDEGNMDALNAVDYDKGCYIGQELTARMHYRGLGKKRLRTIKLSSRTNPAKPLGEDGEAEGSDQTADIEDPSTFSASPTASQNSLEMTIYDA